jgi:uncharacterized membrane protein
MNELLILRLIHIFCGVFWAGATIYLAAFIGPAVQSSGQDGSRFMQQLARTNKLPFVMMIAAILNVVSGLRMLWIYSGGFNPSFMGSRHGIVLTTGGTLAIIAFLIGLMVTRPAVEKIARLGAEIGKVGGPPSAEQAALLGKYRKRIFSGNKFVATLLAFTVVAMAIADTV